VFGAWGLLVLRVGGCCAASWVLPRGPARRVGGGTFAFIRRGRVGAGPREKTRAKLRNLAVAFPVVIRWRC